MKSTLPIWKPKNSLNLYAGCTLSPSAFGDSLRRELPETGRVRLYTLAESSQFWCATRGDSQARHETLWLVHHRPLKKRDLNEARHKHRGYTRGSKARRVFPSTFLLSPCIGFPRRACTADIKYHDKSSNFGKQFAWRILKNL